MAELLISFDVNKQYSATRWATLFLEGRQIAEVCMPDAVHAVQPLLAVLARNTLSTLLPGVSRPAGNAQVSPKAGHAGLTDETGAAWAARCAENPRQSGQSWWAHLALGTRQGVSQRSSLSLLENEVSLWSFCFYNSAIAFSTPSR